MINLKKSEWFVLIGLILLSLVPVVVGILRLAELGVGSDLELLPQNPRVKLSPLPVGVHLFSSIPYCILGAFQFLPSIRANYPKWHRLSGRFLVVAGIVSALSGLWMTLVYSFPIELQGTLLYLVRIIVSICMVIFIYFGLSAILQKGVMQHRAWMMRAYALGQGAGTQVFITIPWALTMGDPSGLERDSLMTAAWVVNILVVEAIIRSAVLTSASTSKGR